MSASRIKRRIAVAAIGGLLLTTGACSGRSNSSAGNEAINEADTLTAEDIEAFQAAEPEPLPLPDTMYQSAKAVRYSVSIIDSTIPPKINSLKDLYKDAPGALTFRNGLQRQADFMGHVKGHPNEIDVDWTYKTDLKGDWGGGTGWTGQPLYVCWPDSMMQRFRRCNLVSEKFSGKEIMVGSLCSKVYFIDFETGTDSRAPVDVYNPIKGTMSLDPTLNGNLYVGHGVPETMSFGALVIDLNKNCVSDTFGIDINAWRGWGAYDSSPVRIGQFLLRPGENGTLYKLLVHPGHLHLQSTLRYSVNGYAPGMESSMSIYRNYGYIADNHGNILCVNLDTMRPVWHYALGDDIDSSIVLIPEGETPYIYTGCEVDKQKEGVARYVKINGLNGQEAWRIEIPARQYVSEEDEKHFDGGFYSTALPGRGDCDSLMFVNCVINDTIKQRSGNFMAINRYTGRVAYKIPLKCYAWSSPVGYVNEHDEMYVVTGDCIGNIYLLQGKNGEVITRRTIGANFESSPVVVDNHFVVGSRGRDIYRMSVVSR